MKKLFYGQSGKNKILVKLEESQEKLRIVISHANEFFGTNRQF